MKNIVAAVASAIVAPVVVGSYAPPAPLPFEKEEFEYGGVEFVYSTRRGCSGRNVTPSEASDILVRLMQG